MPANTKEKDAGLRKRNKVAKNSSNGEKDTLNSKPSQKPTKAAPPKPSGGGMTCLNWFFVLLFILGASATVGFFVHNEMTILNRAVLQQIRKTESQTPDISGINEQLKAISSKLEVAEGLRKDVATMKEEMEAKSVLHFQLVSQMKESKQDLKELSNKFSEYAADVKSLKNGFDGLQSSQESQLKVSEKSDAALQKMNQLIDVASTNVASLSDELIRLDKQYKVQFGQISSIQKEVISLTADKVQMSSAMDSMKTTIVSVREKVQVMQEKPPQGGAPVDMEDIQSKIQKIDERMSAEIGRVSRQISETSENSAKWLQQSTNDLSQRFQRNVEELNKQLQQFKAEIPSAVEATNDQSLVNAVAAFDAKLQEMGQALSSVGKLVQDIDGKREKNEKLTEDELADYKDSIVKLTDRVIEVKSRDDKLESTMAGLTSQVTKLSNELNGIRSVARILEKRVEEIRTGRVEEPPRPAEPDQPEQMQLK